jgi:hypothetical protein
VWWWIFVGLAGMVGASVWNLLTARRVGSCVDEMTREAARAKVSPARRLRQAAAYSLIGVAVIYGLYKSVDVFVS